ncbi:MAG: FAD-binding protein [Oscillospiraceae bacterium]|nr:FAD-binding protein [Oscillospiraceae bacterium]
MIQVIGAGLAGLSAAIRLAEQGIACSLISAQPSERAQSVLAEGGINAALDTMGEGDSPAEHFADTVRGGCALADETAVRGLCDHAPEILKRLTGYGVPFNMRGGKLLLRNFGGQKKKRTAYARSSTGKIIMTALIDEARKYESAGLIRRFPHHECLRLLTEGGACIGVRIRDSFTGALTDHFGSVILCSGGMNGLFPGMTTGTTQNTGDLTAAAFCAGVRLANPEMIQYHPTTVGISGKRCLVTEAARGEGGRLCILRSGRPWYFMEEKYPELGNLMPRDVVAREMFFVRQRQDTEGSVLLDLTALSGDVWKHRLSDLREELLHYLSLDPKQTPIPVQEGIHYFMGGIEADPMHRTSLCGLFAAGECCAQYHGANRLGGNSMLGAVYGGTVAAESAAALPGPDRQSERCTAEEPHTTPADPAFCADLRDILLSGLGIVRSADTIRAALDRLYALSNERAYNMREQNRLHLAEAMLLAAEVRHESRGAHYRADFPQTDPAFRKTASAEFADGAVRITFRALPEEGELCG